MLWPAGKTIPGHTCEPALHHRGDTVLCLLQAPGQSMHGGSHTLKYEQMVRVLILPFAGHLPAKLLPVQETL